MKKEKSNYIKYCLRNKECAEMDGCFHIWKEKPEYKDKILIYGPNGSGKSSLIKELMAKKSDNQEIMVFDDAFIHTHIFHNKMDEDGKQIIKQQLHSSKTKTLPNALKFHTKELDDLTKEKTEYTKQKEELDDNSNEWDNQLFKWFFTIISIETNKESSKETYENFLASWKLYWNDNDFLIKDSYNQQKYNWLEESWYWSAEKFKLKIQKNFRIDDFVLNDIRSDFINRNKKFSKVNFFDYLQRKKSKIKENSKNISKEIDEYTKFLNGLKQKEIIFKIWHDRFNSKTKKNENVSFSPENKSKILNWYQEGIAFYENFSLNDTKCIFCFQKYLIKKKEIYSEFKSYNERDYKLLSNLKTIKAIYVETILIIEEILEKIQQLKIQIPELKDKINNIVDSNKSEINFEFEKFIPNKLVSFFNEINLLLEDYLIKNKPKDESISDNFIEKQFEKDDFKKIIIEIKSARKWFGKHLSAKIDNLQGKIKDEEEKLQKELKDQFDKIQNYWNFPIKIELETSKDSKGTLIKIVGENKKKIIRFLSVGELKGLAIIIFFLYLKRNISKNNPENSSNKEYLIIFDDVFDGLDFTAAFRFNNLLKWFLKNVEEINKKSQQSTKIILLTHQFDFINFFHNQYKEEEFDFFRLFKKNDKPKHAFVQLNLNELIQTKLRVFRKYFDKMIEQFKKYTVNGKKPPCNDLINQVIFWSITRITLEIILTHKINLQDKKVNWNKNCDNELKEYLKELFSTSNTKKEEKETKDNYCNLVDSNKIWITKITSDTKDIALKNTIISSTTDDFTKLTEIIKEQNKAILTEVSLKNLDGYITASKTVYGDWTDPTNYEFQTYDLDPAEIVFQIKGDANKTIKGLVDLETRIAEQGGTALTGSEKEKLEKISGYHQQKTRKRILNILDKWKPSENTFIFISKENKKNNQKKFDISQKELFDMTKAIKDFLFKIKIINQEENENIEEKIKNFNSDDIISPSIEFEVLEKHLKCLLKKICLKNNISEKEENEKDKNPKFQKENWYIEYVLLQRAIFFLRGKCQKVEELKEYYSNLFIFLRHAHNNFFPSLLIFDASFEKILESAE